MPILRERQLRRLLGSLQGTGTPEGRGTAIMRLFLDTGMRLSELAGLPLERLHLDVPTATVSARAGGSGPHRAIDMPLTLSDAPTSP